MAAKPFTQAPNELPTTKYSSEKRIFEIVFLGHGRLIRFAYIHHRSSYVYICCNTVDMKHCSLEPSMMH